MEMPAAAWFKDRIRKGSNLGNPLASSGRALTKREGRRERERARERETERQRESKRGK